MTQQDGDLGLAKPAEVAAYLRTTVPALAVMRHRGIGPRYIKTGERRVLYRWVDVYDYLDAHTYQGFGS